MRRSDADFLGQSLSIDADFRIAFFAPGLGKRGCGIVEFEYPYKASQRRTSRQMPSDRELILSKT